MADWRTCVWVVFIPRWLPHWLRLRFCFWCWEDACVFWRGRVGHSGIWTSTREAKRQTPSRRFDETTRHLNLHDNDTMNNQVRRIPFYSYLT
jgi:hypothetical protein